MPSTVLGKRTRSSVAVTNASDARWTVNNDHNKNNDENYNNTTNNNNNNNNNTNKRTRRFVILDQQAEKENPFITPKKGREAVQVREEEITPAKKRGRPPGSKNKNKNKNSNNKTTPAEYIAPAEHIAPAKHIASAEHIAPATNTAPSTPRHRHTETYPQIAVTPRHRLLVAGQPFTPRTPTTPRNSTPTVTVYNEARHLFARPSASHELYGRDEERKELATFISTHTQTKKSGCIYVSGPPGTGKSAFVHKVCADIEPHAHVKTGYVNCMSIKDAKDLYRNLLEQFVDDITDIAQGDEMEAVKALFFQPETSYLVTLDEVDHLLDLDLDLLYTIFEWSLQEDSRLVLIGIANALDLADRFLPRLRTRGLKPHLLPFLPYTAPQIASVITSKLQSLLPLSSRNKTSHVPFIHPTAIQFLSKKLAAQSGDLRRAFDICRRAIDLIEAQTRQDLSQKKSADMTTPSPTPSPSKTPLVENMNLSSPSKFASQQPPVFPKPTSQCLGLTVENAPRATIAHVARITAAVFSHGATRRLQNLNLQQKAVLCALAALEKKNKKNLQGSSLSTTENPPPTTPSKRDCTNSAAAAPTIKSLYTAYSTLCKTNNLLHPLTSTEFRDILGSLETLSLVSPVDAGRQGSLTGPSTPSKRGRSAGGFVGARLVEERRVAGVVAEGELSAALTGAGGAILRVILEGAEGLL
ncbi:cell division control protein Cdc6 [Delitschia confertaspora ATCC 74209]|uniref:Cell division control protein n=1 Tax=Delitschia confertaspora ATCC 74209 TaxID=1513339 RepID=A0A9P4JVY5_9PLEO|nr:cell division control protein Cdc6 [Delitschia confertaspora ATCC 74209]